MNTEYKLNSSLIRLRRLSLRLSLYQLAKRTNLSRRHILYLETGQFRDPRLSTLSALSSALGVTIEELIIKVPTE